MRKQRELMTNNEYQNFVVILKPDAVDRRLIGKILARFEQAGFWVEDMKMGAYDVPRWAQHYVEHQGKPHFANLCDRMANQAVVVLVLSGQRGIARARRMIGGTDALEAAPGTIRGDFGNLSAVIADNLIHVSDSEISADREIALWFGENNGE